MSIKYCEKCDKAGEATNFVRKVRKTVVQSFGSSGCSIRAYYYCPDHVPSEEDLPNPSNMIVGAVIRV